MAKHKITYRLPEEQSQYNAAMTGMQWYQTCRAMDEQLRQYLKYKHNFKTAEAALKAMRAFLLEEMQDRNLDFEMVE